MFISFICWDLLIWKYSIKCNTKVKLKPINVYTKERDSVHGRSKERSCKYFYQINTTLRGWQDSDYRVQGYAILNLNRPKKYIPVLWNTERSNITLTLSPRPQGHGASISLLASTLWDKPCNQAHSHFLIHPKPALKDYPTLKLPSENWAKRDAVWKGRNNYYCTSFFSIPFLATQKNIPPEYLFVKATLIK